MCDSVCRIVVEEEQTGQVQQMNAGLQKQVQQLEAALKELGREHQTLQVSGDGARPPLKYILYMPHVLSISQGPPSYNIYSQTSGERTF